MLKDLLRWCNITNSGKDDKQFPAQQIGFLGKTADAVVIFPYGMHANIPPDTLALVASIQGHNANKSIIGVAPVDRPQLEAGEVVVYHPKSGSTITLKDNGDIDLEPGSGVMNLTGELTVTGDLTVDGDTAVKAITSNSKDIGSTHTHTGSPSAPTGAVTPTGAPL